MMRMIVFAVLLALAAPAAAQGTPPAFDAAVAGAKAAMMADPAQALVEAERAAAIVAPLPRGKATLIAGAQAAWLKGEALTRLNRPDEASPIVEAALALVVRTDPGSKLEADLLMSRGPIAAMGGDPQRALQSFQRAHDIFRAVGEPRRQAIALQYIGMIYKDAGDNARALQYYDQAYEIFNDDPSLNIAMHNNRGAAYKDLGDYAKAEAEFRSALKTAREIGSPLLEVRILTNIAETQLLRGQPARADATVSAGLKLAGTGDASAWAAGLWGVRAQIAHARGDDESAARLLARTFDGVDLATTTARRETNGA